MIAVRWCVCDRRLPADFSQNRQWRSMVHSFFIQHFFSLFFSLSFRTSSSSSLLALYCSWEQHQQRQTTADNIIFPPISRFSEGDCRDCRPVFLSYRHRKTAVARRRNDIVVQTLSRLRRKESSSSSCTALKFSSSSSSIDFVSTTTKLISCWGWRRGKKEQRKREWTSRR